MRGGVFSDDVHDSGARTARVVQVGKPICQTRPEMKQRRCWMAAHAIPAIRSTRGDPFKKHQHAAQTRIFESCQEVHLRRAGVRETYPHALSNQSSDQAF